MSAISEMIEWFLFLPKQPFNITLIQVYASTINAEEADVSGSVMINKTFKN